MRPFASVGMGWGAWFRAGAFAALALFSSLVQAQTNCPTGQASLQYIVTVGSGFGTPVPSSMSGSTHRDYSSPVAGCVAFRNYLLTLPAGSAGRLAAEQRPYCLTTSTTSANMCFNTSGSGCGSTFNVQMSSSACSSCPAGKTAVDGVCVTPTTACPAAGTVMFTGTRSIKGVASGSAQCYQGCNVTLSGTLVPRISLAVTPGAAASGATLYDRAVTVLGNSSTTWTATGTECTGGAVEASDTAISASGTQYVKAMPDGCGYVNGAKFCASDLPGATNCATGSDGSRVCGSASTTPPVPIKAGTGTGAVPGTVSNPAGTPAIPAEPADATATIETADEAGTVNVFNHYDTTTVNNQGGDGTGSTGGTQSGNDGGTCGGPGQGKCGVTIDESGLEGQGAGDGETLGGAFPDPEAQVSDIEAASANGADALASVLSPVFGTLGDLLTVDTECQSVNYSIAGAVRPVPGEAGCNFLDGIKQMAGWFLGMLCAFACIDRVLKTLGATK